MTDKNYAMRSGQELDKAGGYYWRHTLAMTREGLHNKSDIAKELGYRDMEIDRLKGELAKLQALSVTSVFLDVVPGYDGMDHEVYATSVEDVVEKLSDMGSRLEDYQLGIVVAPVAADTLPMQPVVRAADGCIRFRENRIVSALLEHSSRHGYSLNETAIGDFTDDEHMQLAQLIGYSVSGYGDLSYASEESVSRADELAEAIIAAQTAQGG